MWSSSIQFSPQSQSQRQQQKNLQNQLVPEPQNKSEIMGQLMQQVILTSQQNLQQLQQQQQQIQQQQRQIVQLQMQLLKERQQPLLTTNKPKKIYNINAENQSSIADKGFHKKSPEETFEIIKGKLISDKTLSPYMLDKIKGMISDKVINLTDSDGNSLLHIAAKRSIPRVIKILLNKSADTTILNKNGETPSKLISDQIDSVLKSRMLDLLSKHKKNDEINPHTNQTNLKRKFNGADSNNLSSNKFVKSNTSIGRTPVNPQNMVDPTEASFNEIKNAMLDEKIMPTRKREKFGKILTNKVVNFQDSDGNTLLHIAAQTSSPVMIEFLLENSADSRVLNKEGNTPTQIAIKNDKIIPSLKTKVINAFSKYVNNDESNPDPVATRENSTNDVLMFSFEHIKKIIIDGPKGGLIYRVGKLISVNPDVVKIKDSDGNTLLHIATKFPSSQIIKALMENGADFTIPNNFGNTPLQIACENANKSLKVIDNKFITNSSSNIVEIFNEYSKIKSFENDKISDFLSNALTQNFRGSQINAFIEQEPSFENKEKQEEEFTNWFNYDSFESETWLNPDEIDLGFQPEEVEFKNGDDNMNERLGLHFY